MPSPTTSTVANLFPEIILELFRYENENRNLKNYSLVCSEWRFLAQEILLAKLTLTNLFAPSPNALPYSAIADARHAHVRRYVRHLAFRIPSDDRDHGRIRVDPHFHAFLQHLTSVRELVFWDDGTYLFRKHYDLAMQRAILHLISLPSLKSLDVTVDYFPVHLITACKHVKHLTVGFVTLHHPIDTLTLPIDNSVNAPVLQTLRLYGLTAQIARFTTNILRETKYNLSLKRLSTAKLCFNDSFPHGRGTILSLLNTVQHLELTCQIFYGTGRSLSSLKLTGSIVKPFKPDPSPILPIDEDDVRALRNVSILEVNFMCTPFTEHDMGYARSFLSQWFIPLLRRFPASSKLSKFRLRIMWPNLPLHQVLPFILDDVPSFRPIWRKLDATLSDDTIFPRLEGCSLYAPWFWSQNEVTKLFPQNPRRWKLDDLSGEDSSGTP